ncbi:GlsB/YeaQ/YmgE family stress response membrane protein [Flavisphingomonas formosensis]|uniref:GlsB/YeaQ/YmgE family stress response membrane protein n=1 Tax=Flavisphingomonas formosensis TaxID=861534 RepID=UPI0012F9A4E2|nr:GlsB/YeaQ/YmgE family stress response membrane protein [Sphingomonas formosensis]
MGLLLTLVIGGVIGWLASIVMRTNAQQGIFLDIVVGIAGALLGGLLFGGSGLIDAPLNLTALLTAFVGAIILLAVINLVRRGTVR